MAVKGDGSPLGHGAHRDLLRAIVAEHGEIDAEELHAEYDRRAARWYFGQLAVPVSRRQRRDVLRDDPAIVVDDEGGTRSYRLANELAR